ncbi:MAG: outer membrane beta-barrel protein [Pseudolabrys sp.]
MRSYFIAAAIWALALGVSQSASAADFPVQMPATQFPSPVYNWTGFYAGGQMGTVLSSAKFYDPTGVNFAPLDTPIADEATGFMGGLQLGFDFQTGNLVFGGQGDVSWTTINTDLADPFSTTTTLYYKTVWLASVTGRAGYAWGNILMYGKGGAAWVHNIVDVSDTAFSLASANETRTGWIAGGGFEYGFTPSWTGFIEYDYIRLGTASVIVRDPLAGSMPINFEQDIQMIKGGINFKFGGL